jgi:hypothetical protein
VLSSTSLYVGCPHLDTGCEVIGATKGIEIACHKLKMKLLYMTVGGDARLKFSHPDLN